jgi:hypothetical protein
VIESEKKDYDANLITVSLERGVRVPSLVSHPDDFYLDNPRYLVVFNSVVGVVRIV